MHSGVDLACVDSEVNSGDLGADANCTTLLASGGPLRAPRGSQVSGTIGLRERVCRMRRLTTDATNDPALRGPRGLSSRRSVSSAMKDCRYRMESHSHD